MRVRLIGFMLMVGGQLFGQTLFADQTRITDSLNSANYTRLKSSGQFDGKGKRTGFWVEYKLTVDTTNRSTPVTIQATDFSLNMKYQQPTTLEKIEGSYLNGQMTGQWNWFEATYYDDSLTWEATRESEYVIGKKHGVEKEYSFGELFREARYSDNDIVGTEILYYPPGVVYVKAQWKAGIAKNATWYYQNGRIKRTKDYRSYPSTKVTDYHENGKVKAKYTVLGDEESIDGDYEEFDSNGKLVARKTFSKGVVVKK